MKYSDDELILYLYQELEDERYDQIGKQLESDEALRHKLQRLSDDLERITKSPELRNDNTRAPAEFKASWHDTISSAAEASGKRDEPVEQNSNWPLMGLAATLLLALGFGFGYLQRGDDASVEMVQTDSPVAQQSVAASAQTSGDIVTGALNTHLGVREHLQNVQNVLNTLNPAEAQQRRRLLKEILLQNELHQKVAQLQGADDLTRLLRAFEQSLLVIAAQESGEVYASREQLKFELGVVLTKLDNEASNRQQSL